MTRIVCPCCQGAGSIDEQTPVPLNGNQLRIFEKVRRAPAGISCRKLSDRVYADRVDGGPDSGDVTIRTTIFFMNRKLKAAGLRIKGTCRGVGSVYKLERIPA